MIIASIPARGLRLTKIGAPDARSDPYHWLMEMGWLSFATVVAATFLLVNLVFAIVYVAMPESIAAMPARSLPAAFFFSTETLATVGYGVMSPKTTGGHVVATIEMLAGLFFSATVTGLIFARFSRPRAMLVCSRVAVIACKDGKRALMTRVASLRAHPVSDLTAQLFWLQRIYKPGGGLSTEFVPLPLAEHSVPLLPLSWMLVHQFEDDTPFAQALEKDQNLRLLLNVSGIYTLLGSQTVTEQIYGPADIRADSDFVDIVSERAGAFVLDLNHIHDTRPRKAETAAKT